MVCQKKDSDGNPISRSNQNPILDTYFYEVEFPRGEIIKLAANIIEKSLYAQFDSVGNEYLLLEAFDSHRKNDSALSVEDQKIFVKG